MAMLFQFLTLFLFSAQIRLCFADIQLAAANGVNLILKWMKHTQQLCWRKTFANVLMLLNGKTSFTRVRAWARVKNTHTQIRYRAQICGCYVFLTCFCLHVSLSLRAIRVAVCTFIFTNFFSNEKKRERVCVIGRKLNESKSTVNYDEKGFLRKRINLNLITVGIYFYCLHHLYSVWWMFIVVGWKLPMPRCFDQIYGREHTDTQAHGADKLQILYM